MSWMVRLALAAGFFAALFVVGFASTDMGQSVSLLNSAGCYARLYNDPSNSAQIFIIGSSRIRRGIQVDELAADMGLPPGSIVNLAHPFHTMDFDLALIERLTRENKVKLVIFEAQVRSPEIQFLEQQFDMATETLTSIRPTTMFSVSLTVAEQEKFIRSRSNNTLLSVWDLSYVQLKRLQAVIRRLIFASYAERFRASMMDPSFEMDRTHASKRIDCIHQEWVDKNLQNPTVKGKKDIARFERIFVDSPSGSGWKDEDPLAYFRRSELARERQIVKDMISLAKRRDFKVAFLYLPSIYVPIDARSVPSEFEKTFGAKLIVPDIALRHALEDGGYRDGSHLNYNGRKLLQPWLAKEIGGLPGVNLN